MTLLCVSDNMYPYRVSFWLPAFGKTKRRKSLLCTCGQASRHFGKRNKTEGQTCPSLFLVWRKQHVHLHSSFLKRCPESRCVMEKKE